MFPDRSGCLRLASSNLPNPDSDGVSGIKELLSTYSGGTAPVLHRLPSRARTEARASCDVAIQFSEETALRPLARAVKQQAARARQASRRRSTLTTVV